MDSNKITHSRYGFGAGSPLFWIAMTFLGLIIPLTQFSRTPDSVHYYDIAKNVSMGKGLTTYHLTTDVQEIPSPRIMWPPVYPLILAILLLLGISAGAAMLIVHIAAFLIISYALWQIGVVLHSRMLGAINVGLWLIVALQTDLPIHPLSESIFIAISLLLVLLIIHSIKYKKYGFGHFFLAGLLAGLAVLCRFAGVSLIIPVLAVPLFLLLKPALKIGDLLKMVAGIAVGLLVIIIPYLLWNLHATGELLPFNRAPTEKGLVFNAVRIIITCGKDLLIAFVIIVFGFLFTPGQGTSPVNRSRAHFKMFTGILLLWIIAYSSLLLYATSHYEMDTISTRLIIPIYPMIIVLLGYLFVSLSGERDRPSVYETGRPVLVSVLILIAVMGASAMQLKENVKAMYLTREKSTNPSLVQWIRKNTGTNDLIIGDRIWEIRYITGRAVLESGYPSQSPLNDSSIAAFLEKFGNDFDDIYITQNATGSPNDDNIADLEKYNVFSRKMGYFELENRDLVLYELTSDTAAH